MKRILLVLLLVLVSSCSWAVYDPTKPANNTPVASAPALIRENERALKDDGIVNAGKLASYTLEEILSAAGGTSLSCVASTTSTEILTPSLSRFYVGTATGAALVHAWFSATASATQAYDNAQFLFHIPVRVATTTELGKIKFDVDYETASSALLWNVSIATSSTRGELVFTASGPVGLKWQGEAKKIKSEW